MESIVNEKVVRLEGYDWKAAINCSKFFPCSQTKLRQFYKKFIMQAVNTEAETVICDLVNYMYERMESIAYETELFREAYIRQNTKRKELIEHRASGKHANGVPITKEERKQISEEIKEMNETCRTLASDINKKVREAERLKVNREYLCGLVVMGE